MQDNCEKDLLSYTNIWAAKMIVFNSLVLNLSVSIRPEIYLHFGEHVAIVAKCKGNSNLVGWLDPLPLILDEGNAPNEKNHIWWAIITPWTCKPICNPMLQRMKRQIIHFHIFEKCYNAVL